jgi:hypothetical protein
MSWHDCALAILELSSGRQASEYSLMITSSFTKSYVMTHNGGLHNHRCSSGKSLRWIRYYDKAVLPAEIQVLLLGFSFDRWQFGCEFCNPLITGRALNSGVSSNLPSRVEGLSTFIIYLQIVSIYRLLDVSKSAAFASPQRSVLGYPDVNRFSS